MSVHGSNVDFADNVRPSIVSTGTTSDVELRSSNVTLNGGVLITGAFSHHGSNAVFNCGIYAATIDLRGSNTTCTSCPQR